ncbi:PqqD family protein [Ectobacillus sp. JY-23]|uniref:PqqD family protein n=1 Tax=Ectobacillus sp. JY-23 TaxID=2933872 RepID=UPI001FF1AA14|nr:PqqD family protein [Ectobacillus sp. JY-23]UOY93322.1 PqqD family protein [Ectobacillus sp. JY-23]
MSITYQCSANLDIVEMDGEWVVLDTESFTITKINEVGASILKGIQAKQSVDSIIKEIVATYAIDYTVVAQDTASFIKELQKIGLIMNEQHV